MKKKNCLYRIYKDITSVGFNSLVEFSRHGSLYKLYMIFLWDKKTISILFKELNKIGGMRKRAIPLYAFHCIDQPDFVFTDILIEGIDWESGVRENKGLDQYYLQKILRDRDDRWFHNVKYFYDKDYYLPKPERIKKKKRRLSYGVQLKNAKKKATKRVKKWLKESQEGNWWVDEFNRSKTYSYSDDNNYDYSYRKSYKVPSWLIEIDTNKWCLNKDKDILL